MLFAGGAFPALAVDPTVTVLWFPPPPGGAQPVLDVNYQIVTTDPAYPEVRLLTESQVWYIFSTDSDNPDSIGDLGEISCPAPENFGVTILAPNLNSPGARDIKGIDLRPSSGANYSNLIKANISGDVLGVQKVQRSSGGTGGQFDETAISGDVKGAVEFWDVGAGGYPLGVAWWETSTAKPARA